MSFTVEQFRSIQKEFARNTFEAGDYTLRVNKVKPQEAKYGFNKGKQVLTFIINPLTDPDNAESYDNSRTLFVDARIPQEGEDQEEFNKAVSALAFWAEVTGVADTRPPKTEDKAASYAAYQEWVVASANAMVDNPSAAEGKCFLGTVKTKEHNGKIYSSLAKKSRL